jgi:hypothetical protein
MDQPEGQRRSGDNARKGGPERVNGGSRLHLRDDWLRTPSGPEGSSGSGFKSGAEVLLARAASQRGPPQCGLTLVLNLAHELHRISA